MRELAWRGERPLEEVNLGRPLLAALELARGEYRYCADVDLDIAELPPVRCNAGEIGQVFINLIVNAAHAMSAVKERTGQRGRLGVRARAEGASVVVDISDTGGGIPETVRARIFEPFFTTKPTGQGTGQGLAIARGIVVEKHGGSLSFDTEMGVGTTFHIRMPAADARKELRVVSNSLR